MAQSGNRSIGPVILEALLVVFGVVLAYAANEWREARQNEARAEHALYSIRDELERNRSSVLESLEYHANLLDTLQTIMESGAADPDNTVFSRGFTHPAPLVSTAWTVAGATDILTYIDYETVLAISRMYEEQETYEYQSKEVGALIYEAMFQEGLRELYHNYRNLFSIIGTFYYRECQLLDRYSIVLTKLDSPAGEAEVPAICDQVKNR